MRTLQLVGFLLALMAVILGYLLLSPVETETPASAAGAVGLGILFFVAPALGISALMLVPSSIALLWPEIRKRTYFTGSFWLRLWAINGILSTGYLLVTLYLGYVLLGFGAGG